MRAVGIESSRALSWRRLGRAPQTTEIGIIRLSAESRCVIKTLRNAPALLSNVANALSSVANALGDVTKTLSDVANAPIRREFGIPANRPFIAVARSNGSSSAPTDSGKRMAVKKKKVAKVGNPTKRKVVKAVKSKKSVKKRKKK